MSKALRLYLARPNLALNTKKSYSDMMFRFMGTFGDKDIVDVRQKDLMHYIAERQADGLTPRSLNLITNFFKGFFGWLWHNEYLEKSPASRLESVRVEPIPDHERAISVSDWQKLKLHVRENSVRDYALLAFMMDSACRVSAAAGLRLDGLDIPNLRAFGYEPKIKARVQWDYSEECAIALERWLAARPKVDHDFVFTSVFAPYKKFDTPGIRVMMKRWCSRVGIELRTPHSLRHTELQHLAQQPGVTLLDVQTKANHKNAKTTLGSYYPERSQRIGELSQRYSLVGDAPKQPEKDPKPLLRILPKSS